MHIPTSTLLRPRAAAHWEGCQSQLRLVAHSSGDAFALAIGRLVIGRLIVRKSSVRSLEIEELSVKRLRVGELIITDNLVTPDIDPRYE